MNKIENVNLIFNNNPFLLIVGTIIIIGIVYFVYRFTIPPISSYLKFILILIRVVIISIMLVLIFEPILSIEYKQTFKPVNLLFVDNSKSITVRDSVKISDDIKNLVNKFQNKLGDQNRVYSFGDGIDSLQDGEMNEFSYTEPITNFDDIFNLFKTTNMNVASAVILSDGIITDGVSPIYKAEKLDFPIYTVGVGDTLPHKDIEIKKVVYNNYIYAGQPTVIQTNILNTDCANEKVIATLSGNNKVIESKNITLSEAGIDAVEFEYTPQSFGEKELKITIKSRVNETTTENNKKIFYVKVLKSKLNVAVISSSPSPDLSFIKTALVNDKNLSVNSITQVTDKSFIETNYSTKLDSADIIFLIGFPGKETSSNYLNIVLNNISDNKTPVFISLAEGTDYNRLKNISTILPFSVGNVKPGFFDVQPEITDGNNILFKIYFDNTKQAFNYLTPVQISNSKITPKPGSDILTYARMRNTSYKIPLIIANNSAGQKSIAVLAKEIWRWKLKSELDNNFFDNFIVNSIKWLNVKDNFKQLTVETDKKQYQAGEKIEFTAQVYDAKFFPLNEADVSVKISTDNSSTEIRLNFDENGIYSGTFENGDVGNYSYTATANYDNKTVGADDGKFNVGAIDIEKADTKLNKNFLFLLSTLTNGKYYYINNQSDLIERVAGNITTQTDTKYYSKKYPIWREKYLLGIIILLFSAEWFIRKRKGML